MTLSDRQSAKVARYFSATAKDFDDIYETDKSFVRQARDKFRGTVTNRLLYVQQVAESVKPQSILDVGCGSGRFAVDLAVRGAEVTGLDFAEGMLTLARQRAETEGVADRCEFLNEDFLAWDPRRHFDLVLAMGVFDYVKDAAPLLSKMTKVTRRTLIASFPRRVHPLVPVRMARLRLNGCPVYFYLRNDVLKLGLDHVPSFEVFTLGRDFILTGTVK
jgi:2-polyprenyl-3-methyl-5-hydroxy-6-metoxy-1,4-benzoquinol methylase